MRILALSNTVCITTLLMSYTPAALAMTEQSLVATTFGMGFFLGALIAVFVFWYLNRHYRNKYQKMLHKLKSAKRSIKVAESSMNTMAQEQQDNQDLLEERVQERTLELNIALQELESANQELERINILDELTGLHNRRFYDQKIVAEYRRSRRNITALSLVVIDIDHFKEVNDTHGHLAGDQCLIWLASHIKMGLKRSTDKAFRYGGEEFCLILPNTSAEGALIMAEQLRIVVAEQPFQFQDVDIPLTISSGIFTYQQQADIGPEQIFSSADKALYKAKHNGRNQTQQFVLTE